MELAVLVSLPIIALFGILGFRDGVVKRLVEIIGVILTLIFTARLAAGAAPWVVDKLGVGEGPALLITWAALFFAGLLLSRFLANMISKALRLTVLGWLDRWGGALVGVAFGTLVASVLLVAASQVPGGEKIQASYDQAPVGRFIFYAAPSLYEAARSVAGDKGDDLWQRVMDKARETADEAARQAKDAAAKSTEEAKEKAREALD